MCGSIWTLRACPVHYSTGAKSAAADLALMRRCRAFVLSNSTFSWWGQWLAGVRAAV